MSNKCEFLHNRATLSMLSYLDDVPLHSTMYVRRTSILLKKEMKTKEIGLFFIPSNMSNVTHVNSQDLSNSIDTAYKLRSYNLIDFVDILVTRTHTESHIYIDSNADPKHYFNQTDKSNGRAFLLLLDIQIKKRNAKKSFLYNFFDICLKSKQ